MTCAQDEASAQGFQVFGERPQTTAKKLLPVGTRPRVISIPGGKNVDRDSFICLAAGVIKRGIIPDSQVAPKPVKDSLHLTVYEEGR
jgi:hypothetical protein